jgi:hypothetical protein
MDITLLDKGCYLIRKSGTEISFLWKSAHIACMICFESIIEIGAKNLKFYECDTSEEY